MKKLFGTKNFYKSVFIILIPIMLQQILTNFVVFIDNFMVGQLGDYSIAGVFAANQLFFIASTTLFGLGAAGSIFMSQFYGKKNLNGVTHTFRLMSLWMTIITFVFIGVILLFGDSLMRIYSTDANVLKEANDYLSIIIWSYVPLGLLFSYDAIFRTSGKPKWSMYGSVVALITNVIFNYMFIFGKWGAPEMGVKGAAMSTLISRIIQLGLYFLFASVKFKEVSLKAVLTTKKVAKLSKDMLVKSWPMMANEFAWSISLSISVAIVATRGENVLAAYGIRHSVSVFGYVIFGSFAAVISVVVGNELGANNLEQAKQNFKWLVFLGFKIALVTFGILWVITPLIVNMFDADPDTAKLAIDFTRFGAALFPIFIINACSFFAIRSGVDMRVAFMLDSLWNWVVFIPALFFFVVMTDLPIVLAFMLGWGTDLFKAMVSLPIAWRGKWAKNIVNKFE